MESEDARRRSLDAISRMRRDNLSLTAAARRAGTTLETVVRHAGRALERKGARWTVKPYDRYTRQMEFLDERGRKVSREVRDSRSASRIADYWKAVDRFLKTGDESLLKGFRGMSFTSRGTSYPFLTDPDVLERAALVGQVTFENLYSRAA